SGVKVPTSYQEPTRQYPAGALALVTGGGGGLGAACANLLSERGVDVFTVDKALGADFQCDITDEVQVVQLRNNIRDSGRTVNILINSAGVQGPEAALTDTPYAQWQDTFR